MSKIVIPKHSADVDEMNAVLRIHYEAKDWVKGKVFKQKLMDLIGDNQYPSSYPKKAQVPAYFGFLESKVSSGGKIIERRISESGIEMYEAILSDDRSERQRLILEALEKIIFGRDNAGCTSSNSDIEAPAILVRCILDTGYCTSSEYAYLVWALNDKCKKYYESLDDVIKARNSGGISVGGEARDYKDWKPILAMVRWGFLIKSDDDPQKVLLHPEVIEKYYSRLQNLMVYNIDKHEEIEDIEEINIDDVSIDVGTETSYKPFRIDDDNIEKISEGHFLQTCDDVEKQKIYIGDQVLLVDRKITRLAAYYSYLVKGLEKKGSYYEVGLQRQFAINRNKEKELVTALRTEDQMSGSIQLQNAMKAVVRYDDYEKHLKIDGHCNKDILPAYMLLRALLTLNQLTNKEQDYLIYSVVNGMETYSDVLTTIFLARRENKEIYSEKMQGYSQVPSIQRFKDIGIFETYLHDGKQGIQINSLLKKRYSETLRRLCFYAVDIKRQILSETSLDGFNLPKVIKAVLIKDAEETSKDKGNIRIAQKQVLGKNLAQGDFVVFLDEKIEKLQAMYVFQVIDCEKKKDGYKIGFERRNVINQTKENEIIKMIKEA